MKFDTLIKNGNVVFPNKGIEKLDIGINNGKISWIGSAGDIIGKENAIDAEGLYVFPGVIDPHMHIGIYNRLEDDFVAETKAAALGGITTIISYYRGKDSYKTYVPNLIKTGEEKSLVDFTFSLGVLTRRHLEELDMIANKYGINSYKFYRNYQDRIADIFKVEDALVLDSADMLDIIRLFKEKSDKMVLCVHCEDMDVQRSIVNKMKAEKGENTLAYFAKTSPDYVETASVLQSLYLNSLVDGNLYIVHLSAATSVDMLEELEFLKGKGVTVETCPHYLVLDEEDSCGLLALVNPPIHTAQDRERLWEGIRNGIITAIGSDNCPNKLAKKYEKGETVWTVTPGFNGAGMILPVLISEGYHKRNIPLENISSICSAEVARVFNLETKGRIEVGADGDFAIIDLEKELIFTPELFGCSDYSVYNGKAFKGWPVYTVSRGEIIQKDGVITANIGRGKFIKRNP